MTLPAGYSLEWTGLYQYAAAARARLRLVVPLTLAIIFGLLVLAFRSVGESVLILLSVPFAMVGGVFLQWMLGYPMTTAVIVGYISLFAVAVQTGIIMVMFIERRSIRRTPISRTSMPSIDGSAARLRPKLMTVAAIVLSLLPVMFSTGAGHGDHEADRRAEHRRHGQLEPARPVHDAVPVRDRRRHPAMVARSRGRARIAASHQPRSVR